MIYDITSKIMIKITIALEMASGLQGCAATHSSSHGQMVTMWRHSEVAW